MTGRRVLNTAADAGAIGMGFSRISGAGYWGVSIESERSDYGVPGDVATAAGLNRHRLGFAEYEPGVPNDNPACQRQLRRAQRVWVTTAMLSRLRRLSLRANRRRGPTSGSQWQPS